MPNIFDQFDAPAQSNPFDQFDAPSRVNRPRPRREVEMGVTHPEFDASSIPGYDPSTGMVEPGRANTGWIDKLGAFSASALDGVPIAGPYILEGVQRLSAGLGPDDGKSEEQRLYELQQATSRARRDNPWTSLSGGVTGAVAGTLPAIAAAPELFGGGAAALGTRALVSGITGGTIGGTDAAVRYDGDPDQIKRGIGWGTATGVFAPIAGNLIGKGWSAARDYFGRGTKPTGEEMTAVIKAMQADGLSPSVINQRLAAMGDEAMPMDLGPNLRQMAGTIAAEPGPGQQIIRSAVGARDAGASQRITSMLDDTLGPAPIPSRVDASIRANQRNLSPAYQQAFRDARAVNTQGVANELDSAIVNLRGEAQSALRNVRQMLNVHGTDVLDPHPGALLQTRQAIDGMLDGATDGNVRRVLSQARQMVDDELTNAVPGIKEIDSRFAELARQREALERGQTVLDSGRSTPRPQELADELAQGVQPQGRMVGPSAVPLRLREGARAEIERIVGTNANDRVALQRLIKGEGDWNPQKLASLWGADKARRVLQVLDAEKAFAETSDIVTRNSATASRVAGRRELMGESGTPFGVREGYIAGGTRGAARTVAVRSVEKALDKVMAKRSAEKISRIAGMLTTKERNEFVTALMREEGGRRLAPEEIEAAVRAAVFLMGRQPQLSAP
jgi:hypothetical protein